MSHHRQHAISWLNKAKEKIEQAQVKAEDLHEEQWYPADMMGADEGKKLRDRITRNLIEISDSIDDAIVLLQSGNAKQLDQVRRMLNAPRLNDDKVVGWYGMLYKCGSIIHAAFQLVGRDGFTNPKQGKKRSAVVHCIATTQRSWEFLDFALWHVNDARIEELYTPEAFREDS